MGTRAERFWSEFLAANPHVDAATPYQIWYFGDGPELARSLADLVLAGVKTATASLKLVNDAEPEKAPIEGGYSVVTSFDGEPLCVLRTTEVRHLPFLEVDARFAYEEGEGDRTLEDWRAGHRAYFSKEAPRYGFRFDDDAIVCCERFELLHPAR